jgi:hypothetical protein
MAYAYFVVHLPHGLFPLVNGGEDAALFCWSFLAIAALGPGAWAVDNLFVRARTGAQVGDVNRGLRRRCAGGRARPPGPGRRGGRPGALVTRSTDQSPSRWPGRGHPTGPGLISGPAGRPRGVRSRRAPAPPRRRSGRRGRPR